MINFNGELTNNNEVLAVSNRGFAYGDALFETIKVSHTKILFWEDHYFRLMASMRIMRMEIPMNFTMEFLASEMMKTLEANGLNNKTARVKISVYRKPGGLYSPETNDVEFVITAQELSEDFYGINDNPYEIDLYKDYFIAPGLLSTIKSNNKLINVLGSIYAKENGLQNCLLLNTEKQVVEALNGNVFVVKNKVIKTAALEQGCLNGIMRKQIMDIVNVVPDYELLVVPISPFELQNADEIFITNVITGIQPVTKYRKKEFSAEIAKDLIRKLNTKIRLLN
jgi:branched-chain amino acid aminotransferase